MHIAYLINTYPKTSHSFIRREMQALEARGVTVSRFSVHRASDSDLVDPRDKDEATITDILLGAGKLGLLVEAAGAFLVRPLKALGGLMRALKLGYKSERGMLVHVLYWLEALIIGQRIARAGAQHVHAHFGTNPAMVALLIGRIFGLPFSFTVHGPEEFDRPRFLSLPEKIAEAAFVVAISSFGRSQLMRLVPFALWPKIKEVHCGLDSLFLDTDPTPAPTPRAQEPVSLLCIGRLCEQKGQAVLLDALARLLERGLKRPVLLTLAGDGEMREELEDKISALGLKAHVEITGWISSDEVYARLSRCHAMVLPSFAEGLPVVLMEALAAGRPVVSTYVAGIPELVRPAENGWLVPAGDALQLTQALEDVLAASPAVLTAMGNAGRMRVLERHSAATEAAKLETYFAESIPAGKTDV